MKDEQIARELLNKIWPTWIYMSSTPVQELASALATARRAGFDAAKEQAAEIADLLANEYDNDEPVEPWDSGANCAANEIAAAIRSMEPKP